MMKTLRGVAHIHSTYSFDGKLALAEVARTFRDKGMDFVLMAEHIEQLELPRIREFIAECRSLTTDKFLLVPGLEIEDLNILLYGTYAVEPYSNYLELARQSSREGAFIIYSHPVKLQTGPADTVQPLLEGVEIWNTRYDGKIAPRASSAKLLQDWAARRRSDDKAAAAMAGLCGLDFHAPADYTDVWMQVAVSAPGEQGLLNALRTRAIDIYKSGNRLPIYRPNAAFALKQAIYRAAHESAYGAFRMLRSIGINPPRQFKQFARKIF
jgi:hypothetical protein